MKPISTREAYGKTLIKIGRKNNDVVVVDADLSVSTKTNLFAKEFPERFVNVGCAEQNLFGTAAGLAIAGKTVFASTYAMFSCRGWEQIRNTIAHDNLNVKIAASHAGLTNSADGSSHQSLEDIALMRAIPRMCVFNPADAIEAEKIVVFEATRRGPSYIRLNRTSTPLIYGEGYEFAFGKVVEVRPGSDIAIIATGTMVSQAMGAASILEKKGVSAMVVNAPTIKPLDGDGIISIAKEAGCIITIEEHSIYGGLGGAVAEVIGERYPTPVRIMGVGDRFGESGDYNHLLKKLGLTASHIAKEARKLVGVK